MNGNGEEPGDPVPDGEHSDGVEVEVCRGAGRNLFKVFGASFGRAAPLANHVVTERRKFLVTPGAICDVLAAFKVWSELIP
jgi:hypothetical protein